MNEWRGWRRFLLGLAVVALAVGFAAAQRKTVEIRNGIVLAVQGNQLIVRGAEGVKEFTIPEDFRFNLDGKMLSVHELQPGMRISSVVTTVESEVPMTSTEVRNVEVVNVSTGAVVIRNEAGEYKKYTAADVQARDIVILREGQPVSIYDLRKGDRITATIVSQMPPQTISESELKVYVQNAPPPPPPPQRPAPAAAPPKPAAPVVAMLPKTASPLPRVALAGLVALALGALLTCIRRFKA